MYKNVFVIHNVQWLTCHKTKTNMQYISWRHETQYIHVWDYYTPSIRVWDYQTQYIHVWDYYIQYINVAFTQTQNDSIC